MLRENCPICFSWFFPLPLHCLLKAQNGPCSGPFNVYSCSKSETAREPRAVHHAAALRAPESWLERRISGSIPDVWDRVHWIASSKVRSSEKGGFQRHPVSLQRGPCGILGHSGTAWLLLQLRLSLRRKLSQSNRQFFCLRRLGSLLHAVSENFLPVMPSARAQRNASWLRHVLHWRRR